MTVCSQASSRDLLALLLLLTGERYYLPTSPRLRAWRTRDQIRRLRLNQTYDRRG